MANEWKYVIGIGLLPILECYKETRARFCQMCHKNILCCVKKLKFAMKIMSNVSQKDFILCCVKDFQFAGLEWNNEGIVWGAFKQGILNNIFMFKVKTSSIQNVKQNSKEV
jgi:hypothetical protein